MAADWTDIENALQAMVVATSGLASDHVIWAYSNASRPAGPFITLELANDGALGAFPDVVQTEDDTKPAGQDIILTAIQTLDCGLRVSCYVPPARSGAPAAPTASSSARAILSQVRVGSALPTQVQNLDGVGVSIYDLGGIDYVPAIAGTDFEGRAVLDLRLYVVDSAVETTTYIDEVDITGKTDGIPSTALDFDVGP